MRQSSAKRLSWPAAITLLAATQLAQAGVVGSQHDLTSSGQGQGGGANTDQVCVFCHTPHGASTDPNASVPLWNKVLGDPTTYTQYSSLGTVSLDGTEAPVGSVSLACLSCHDGTQAMDVVLNQPGSGGFNPGGGNIGGIGPMQGTPVPVLGLDLTDDHPISIQYGGGGATSADADGPFTGALGDTDFEAPVKATINNTPVWWVDSVVGTPNIREKTDMILYTRDDLGPTEPFVECGSCHDPHNDLTKSETQVAFLRISNVQSRVCTTCHIK